MVKYIYGKVPNHRKLHGKVMVIVMYNWIAAITEILPSAGIGQECM